MGKESGSPGLITLQIWSNLILADLIGNVQSLKVLHSFSRQAGAEMLNYIDAALLDAKTTPIESPRTLVEYVRQDRKVLQTSKSSTSAPAYARVAIGCRSITGMLARSCLKLSAPPWPAFRWPLLRSSRDCSSSTSN